MKYLLTLLSVLSSTCFASGVITVSGKLTSITDSFYLVETNKSVFFIQKGSVNPQLASTLTQTEVPVTLTVPFDAIAMVKTKNR